MFFTLHQSGVIQVCDYSAGVWGYENFECLDNVQNRAMRFLLGVNKFAPVHALYEILGGLCLDTDDGLRNG